MLNAREAASMVEVSDANVTAYLERLDPLVKAEAEKGKRVLTPFLDRNTHECHREYTTKPTPTPLTLRLIEKLKGLGYRADWAQLGPYEASSGFGSLDDEDTREKEKYATFGLRISW